MSIGLELNASGNKKCVKKEQVGPTGLSLSQLNAVEPPLECLEQRSTLSQALFSG